jgi:GDP/UDP-N,N'-diacetylbacillosamine 2-epimerase (hydrolysing)
MFAACASVLPFGLPIAHIHGGETTLGAIDDAFRNSITHMATLHFTIANEYYRRVIELKGSDKYVYNVGALSIDNLKTLRLLSIEEFNEQFNIDLKTPSILVTFHPETVNFQMNERYIGELIAAMREFSDYQIVITMPNADTMGNMIREKLIVFIKQNKNAIGVESLGTLGYLSCMKHCSFMLGNTSSGFVEASYFPKYVVNLGRRQLGRLKTENIYNCQLKKNKIIEAVNNYKTFRSPKHIDIYGDGMAANKIISILKSIKFG